VHGVSFEKISLRNQMFLSEFAGQGKPEKSPFFASAKVPDRILKPREPRPRKRGVGEIHFRRQLRGQRFKVTLL